MKRDLVGIMGIGVYIPEHYHDSEKISTETGIPREIIEKKFGIKRKPVPGPKDHVSYMAARASEKAIERAGINPDEIDLVIWTGAEHKDYPIWTAGIKLQYDIGATKAWAYDIALRCGTTILAMKVAKDMMLSDSNIKTVLLAGGYRNGDLIDYTNPNVSFMYDLGASGAAMILRRGYNKNVILESSFVTDGSLSETVVVPAGGTRKPLTPEAVKNKEHFLEVTDKDFMRERLGEVSMPNFVGVIRDSVEKSGYSIEDIDYLAILHMKRSAHDYVIKELGLQPEKTIYLEDYGHMGQNDQIISLDLALQKGKVKEGNVISFVSAGVGYAWNATTIKWGKY